MLAPVPRPMPNAIAAALQNPNGTPASTPFTWGADGTPITADALARQRKATDALRPDKAPTGIWSLLGDLADEGVASYRDGKSDDQQSAGQKAVADALARKDYITAMGNDFATPQQEAVASALQGRDWQAQDRQTEWSHDASVASAADARRQADPGYQADLAYKQAQTDALNAKPAQPLINAGSGELYDPNTKTWLSPPAANAASSAPPVELDSNGAPDPDQQTTYLSALDPKYAAIVKGVANYELDPSKVTSLRGDQRQKLVEDTKAYDPTYDGTQFAAKAATRKDFMAGQSALNLKSANTLIGHLNDLAKASVSLGNQGFTPLNAVVNAGKGMTGNPAITNYNVTAQAAADELAKVFKGSGASDVASIEGWQHSLDANNSPEQQQSAIRQAVTLLESRVAALRDQYQNAMGKPATFTFLNTESAKALKDLGINPADVDPNFKDGAAPPPAPAGDAAASSAAPVYATNPQTGERLMLQNGQWVPAK